MYPYLDKWHYVPTYYVLMMLGLISSFLLAYFLSKKLKFDLAKTDIFYYTAYILAGAFVGAKLLFCLTCLPNIFKGQLSIMDVLTLEGGYVFYGGVIGGLLMGILAIKIFGFNPKKYLNLTCIVLPLGHMFGRLGCFFSGCCYGKPTKAWYGVVFKEIHDPNLINVKVVPIQLFEAIFLFGLFIFLLIFALKKKIKNYEAVSIYLIGYGVWRFIIEFFRGDIERGIMILSTSQWISLILIGGGIALCFKKVYNWSFLNTKNPIIMRQTDDEKA